MQVYKKRKVVDGFVIDQWETPYGSAISKLVESNIFGIPYDSEELADKNVARLNHLAKHAALSEMM
jgi:hypothetical protein